MAGEAHEAYGECLEFARSLEELFSSRGLYVSSRHAGPSTRIEVRGGWVEVDCSARRYAASVLGSSVAGVFGGLGELSEALSRALAPLGVSAAVEDLAGVVGDLCGYLYSELCRVFEGVADVVRSGAGISVTLPGVRVHITCYPQLYTFIYRPGDPGPEVRVASTAAGAAAVLEWLRGLAAVERAGKKIRELALRARARSTSA